MSLGDSLGCPTQVKRSHYADREIKTQTVVGRECGPEAELKFRLEAGLTLLLASATVTLAKSWQPHLIWMNMQMPVMDGYEATEQIKGASQDLRSHYKQ